MTHPPTAEVARAHLVLQDLIADLDDAHVREPSALPGWSRGHVLAHLTDNARMFARLAEHALRGELVPTYDGGAEERDAIIDAAAGRGAGEHRAALAGQIIHLESVWAKMGETDWGRPVSFRDADLTATAFARWREVWIHLADLGLGVGPEVWPLGLAAHAVDFLSSRLPAGASLHAVDVGRQWPHGDGTEVVITGRLRDLAAWLAGRAPATSPTAPGGLPELGPWPPHPPAPRG